MTEREGRRRNDAGVAVPFVTDAEFALFQRLIHEEAGIMLAPHKRTLLANRLSRRLRELGLANLSAYYRRIKKDGSAELRRLLDLVSTNETKFFREPSQVEPAPTSPGDGT